MKRDNPLVLIALALVLPLTAFMFPAITVTVVGAIGAFLLLMMVAGICRYLYNDFRYGGEGKP